MLKIKHAFVFAILVLLQPHYIQRASAASTPTNKAVPPSIQYAQNSSHVMVEVKFSRKASAPARTGFKAGVVSLNCDNAQCKLALVASDASPSSSTSFFFKVDEELSHAIVPESSTHRIGAAGRYIFVLNKQEPGIRWGDLFQSDYWGSVKLWIDMSRQLYLAETNSTFNELDEDIDDEELHELFEEFEEELKKKKKRKEGLKKNAEQRKKQKKEREASEEKQQQKKEAAGTEEADRIKGSWFDKAKNFVKGDNNKQEL